MRSRFPGGLAAPAAIAWLLWAAVPASAQDFTLDEYLGDMGGTNVIRMSLQRVDSSIRGIYFYKRWLKDIPLTGTLQGRQVVVEERAGRQLRGTFRLEYAVADPRSTVATPPLDREVLAGTWSSADGKRVIPVYLRMTGITRVPEGGHRYTVAGVMDPVRTERNIKAFRDAVLRGQASRAARYIRFPLPFDNGNGPARIESAREFVESFPRIFDNAFLKQVREAIPHHMFANSDGIRLGQGEVWFDAQGRVIRLNNGS